MTRKGWTVGSLSLQKVPWSTFMTENCWQLVISDYSKSFFARPLLSNQDDDYDSANGCCCVWVLRLCWEILHRLSPTFYGAHFFPSCPTGWRKRWKSWASSPLLAPVNANVSSLCGALGFSPRCFGSLLWKTQLSESESGDRAVAQPEWTTSLFPRWGHGGCRQPERNHTAVFVIHVSNLTVLLTRHLQSCCSGFDKIQTWNYSFQWVVDHA